MCLDGDGFEGESETSPRVLTGPENLAYVMYTSGSTGRPKGIEVMHRAVVRLVWNTNYVQLDAGDRIGQASNASFDAATFEIWGALLHGGCLVGIATEEVVSPQALADRLRQSGITVLFLTTAVVHRVSQEVPAAFASLKTLLIGGDVLDPRRIREIFAHGRPERLLNGYGPTETTTFAAWFEVEAVEAMR